jgi:tRNA-Thr(GGU) m(6)t(6)A37 methyltransferase TsaA
VKALWLRFLDWFSRRFGIGRTPVPREPLSLRPIAVVRNSVKQPRPDGWEQVRSSVIVREDLAAGLEGIDGFSHILVIFAFDKVPEGEQRLNVRATLDERSPRLGVLATRSQRRPTPLGVSAVRLLRRRGNVLWVQGLDAIDGTPVLDIKPYYPEHDAVEGARVPDWAMTPDWREGSPRG